MSPPKKEKGPPKPSIITRPRVLFSSMFLALGVVVALLSVRGPPPRKLKFEVGDTVRTVTPQELATWGVEGRRDYVVVDLRPDDDFTKGHIRGAVSCGSCHQTKEEGNKAQRSEQFVDLTKKLVVYTETGTESVALPRSLATNPTLVRLAGGYQAWQAQVMGPVTFGGERDEAELLAKKKAEALRAFYAGERINPDNVAKLPLAPLKRESAHAPAKATEGC